MERNKWRDSDQLWEGGKVLRKALGLVSDPPIIGKEALVEEIPTPVGRI
jgi:hypothetical protein